MTVPTSVVDLAREQVLLHFRWIDGDADTWSMLADADALSAIVAGLAHLAAQQHPEVIVGVESRGFALGAAVAVTMGAAKRSRPPALSHRARRCSWAPS